MNYLFKNFTRFDESGEAILTESLWIEEGMVMPLPQKAFFETAVDFSEIDLNGNYLVPGLVDLQVNGGDEVFFSHTPTEKVLEQMYHDHLKHGTTAMLPTLVTSSREKIIQAIHAVSDYIKKGKPGVLGIHLEGPFLNIEKKGAHNPKYIRKPTDDELLEILEAGRGIIKMMTIAPEIFTKEQLELLRSHNIILAAGHSNCSLNMANTAFDSGVTCVTHLFNAMSAFSSREPGLTGAVLDRQDVYASIVADGFHCDFTAVRIAYKLKKGTLFLVSDATFIGNKDLEMDGIKFIHQPGRYINAEGNLAGSNITMLDAVKQCVTSAGIPLHQVINMASKIPLEAIRMPERKIESGRMADFIILSADNLDIKAVYTAGDLKVIN